GVVVTPTVEDAIIRFRASSYSLPASRPKLTITYTAATAPTITSAAPTATGTVGIAYAFQVMASAAATATTTFDATGLPALGLTLSPAGLISGTPNAPGTISGTLRARNGTAPDAAQPFTIVINPAPSAPAITSPLTA